MIGLEARGQVFQHVATSLAAGRHHAPCPFHEPAPSFAICPTADPSPDHRGSQGSLRRVVRRLDPFEPRECPQPLFHDRSVVPGDRVALQGPSGPAVPLTGIAVIIAELSSEPDRP
jgi:hypothetical protein